MEEIEERAEVAEQAVAEVTVEDPADRADTDVAEMTEATADVEGGLNKSIKSLTTLTLSTASLTRWKKAKPMVVWMKPLQLSLKVAVEGLYKRLGVTRRKPMPALESFGPQVVAIKPPSWLLKAFVIPEKGLGRRTRHAGQDW